MATTEEIVEYYVNLLIIQYIQKAKARVHIASLVRPVIMDQLPVQVQDAFDINTAEGVQLDVLGKYTGVNRNTRTFSGTITLSDKDFRFFIRFEVIKNNSGSDLKTIL